MNDFKTLYENIELNNLLSSINEVDPNTYSACHGIYHAKFVANRTANILDILLFNKRTVEIGKIAGLLHDIGCVFGKHGHATKSAQMCLDFLDKTNCTQSEKNTITQAIADHSSGNDIKSEVGAALLIADKTDLSKERIVNPTDLNNYHRNLMEVERVDIAKQGSDMVINFIASDRFSPTVLYDLWSKAFTIPMKAANYLGCSVSFTVNKLPININT